MSGGDRLLLMGMKLIGLGQGMGQIGVVGQDYLVGIARDELTSPQVADNSLTSQRPGKGLGLPQVVKAEAAKARVS